MADVFQPGDHVDVVGTSKGRGFAGVVKRYHFAGGPHYSWSIRSRAFDRRYRSLRNPRSRLERASHAGHMGAERVTSQNIEVVVVDPERNLLAVRGSVPGPNGGFVVIKEARKQKVAKGGK